MNRVGVKAKRVVCLVFAAVMVLSSCQAAFAKVGQTYVSRVDGLRVRRQPGATEIITKLSKGEKVIHKGTSNGWWLIKTADGYSGYVYRTYLKSASQKLVKNAYYKVYKTNNLTVYDGPRSTATKLGTVKRGSTVQLKAKRDSWGYVKLSNGNKGWVQVKYLSYLRG